MQHIVFGAGLVGRYLAASLMHNGSSVAMVCRPAKQAALAESLRITDYCGNDFTVGTLPCVGDNRADSRPDYLWVCTKCTSLSSAIADIKPHINRHTLIICLQNGLGAEHIMA